MGTGLGLEGGCYSLSNWRITPQRGAEGSSVKEEELPGDERISGALGDTGSGRI